MRRVTYLNPEQARDFYSRVGRWQDTQAFYERRPVAAMLAQGAFGDARSVLEFGCGTGKLARELMSRLPSDGRYLGLDVSPEMVRLATERLRPWDGRAEARLSDGAMRFPLDDGACDRVVSTYVFDLLSPEDARAAAREAARVLGPGGLLCVVSLTPGESGLARLVSAAWARVWAWRPALLGGCRPIRLADALEADRWAIRHRSIVTSFGIASEVLVARRLP
jgi:ubiquinone/menaquinone biosynthesis C-methylase UbiE